MRFPIIRLLLIIGSMGILLRPAYSQTEFCTEARALIDALENYHYQPRELDDAFSRELYEGMLLALDEDGLYFQEESNGEFASYQSLLDEKLQLGNCAFFDSLGTLFKTRLSASMAYIDQWEQAPIAASMENPQDTGLFARTQSHWEERWNAHLSLLSLREYFRQQDSLSPSNQTAFEQNIDAYRARACERARCEIRRIQAHPLGFETYLMEVVLNQLTALYDPHTSYFSPLEKASFESSLDSEQSSFGLSLEENEDGEVEIDWLTPGGPAWKSQVLNRGDIILGLQFEGESPVDLSCINLEAIQQMLDSGQDEKLYIKVRKNSGQTQDVELRREQVVVEENIVSGYVLEGDRKLGYIYLPGFYTSFEEENGVAMGCANDMAQEILKLQLAGIEGLILDLRFNGGGAMSEAIGLAGIFLDQGPMSILEDRTEGISVLKDYNRGVMYSGPLLVMVNGMSASASELFAAVMQDYQRGIILGAPTFGKSTAQIILPLNYASDYSRSKGFVKVTNDKFFRVTGQTHQGKGVQPDIRLPEFWEKIIPREWEYPHMLAATPVDRQPEFKRLPDLPLDRLEQKSAARVNQHPVFPKVKLLADSLGQLYDQVERLELDFQTYRKLRLKQERLYEAYDELMEQESSLFEAGNYPQRQVLLPFDEALSFRNARSLKRIQRDVYIEEAYQILSDLLGQP